MGFADWKAFEKVYGNVGKLPSDLFLNPMSEGDEVEIDLRRGETVIVKLASIQPAREDGKRTVQFEVNGERWFTSVTDQSIGQDADQRRKAEGPNEVGSPMPGVIVGLMVKEGDVIAEGDPLATLSAMKMETVIPATASGVVKYIPVTLGDKVEGDELIAEIDTEYIESCSVTKEC